MRKPNQYKLLILVAMGGLAWAILSCASIGQNKQDQNNGDDLVAKNATQRQSSRKAGMKLRELTKEEANVILRKGTERPFSGKFVNNHEDGFYTCKQCGQRLFHSSAKFDSGTGWPSFDDQIGDNVLCLRDADGQRVEIVCANCNGHLGHVFTGEMMTDKSTRYCVNSISLDFEPRGTQTTETAVFAGGCYWGVEHLLKQEPGVLSTTVGFMGGDDSHKPSYQEVCTHTTGHAEAVEVLFDPNIVSYEKLAKSFFEIHDFTQLNRQGPDVGDQYRSAVFYHSDAQKQTVEGIIATLKQKGYDVKTQVVPATRFWAAKVSHQDYYTKNGQTPYCHVRKKIFD